MTPLQSHCRKQQAKLISSKFVYYSPKKLPKIKKATVAALPRVSGSDMAAAMLLTSFGQKPSFLKEKVARSTTFRLQQIFISKNGQSVPAFLNTIMHTLFPYQKESEPLTVLPSNDKVLSWSIPKCRPSTQVDPLSFTCSTEIPDVDFICSIQHEALSFTEAIFLLRLAQVPIQLR